jgi:hypothetical protein
VVVDDPNELPPQALTRVISTIIVQIAVGLAPAVRR